MIIVRINKLLFFIIYNNFRFQISDSRWKQSNVYLCISKSEIYYQLFFSLFSDNRAFSDFQIGFVRASDNKTRFSYFNDFADYAAVCNDFIARF